MSKVLIAIGVICVVFFFGFGIFAYVDMWASLVSKKSILNAYANLVKEQDEEIIALKRLVDALKEKIRLMEAGADNG